MNELDLDLKKLAKNLRKDILLMITKAKTGHPGGSLSAIDIILYLYKNVIRHKAKDPFWPKRDRFVLSKGHGVPALYAVLAHEGYFDKELLWTLRQVNSPLQGHPANRLAPGIECSTGSLGQGLSMAMGMALAARINNEKNPLFNVYALLGDGELDEGQVWEALMASSYYQVDNLCIFIDRNQGQIDGFTKDVMELEPLADKLKSFGLRVLSIDGHSFLDIEKSIETFQIKNKKPTAIIANTIKGKGVSFLEDDTVGWHGKALSKEELQKALKELED